MKRINVLSFLVILFVLVGVLATPAMGQAAKSFSNVKTVKLTATGATALSGAITAGAAVAKRDAFTTTATIDTVVWAGVAAGSVLVATPVLSVAGDTTSGTTLWVRPVTDSVFVYRTSKTAPVSGLGYSIIRLLK